MLSLSQATNFRLIQTERLADDNIGGKRISPKRIENTVEKGEIDCFEQCLIFSVFSKGLNCRHAKIRVCLRKSQNVITEIILKIHVT